jgi:hypothetical protein
MDSMTVGGNLLAVRKLADAQKEVQVCEFVGISGADGAYVANVIASVVGASAPYGFTIQGAAGGVPVPISGTVNAALSVGTFAAPMRVDPTGVTPQPVTGPVTDAQMRATPIPVSGFPATQPISAVALPLPAGAATETTLSTVNGKIAAAVVSDYDSGVGTVNLQIMGIALPGAGGPVQGGTAANPFRTDPTGTTPQPVTGPVTDAQLRATPLAVTGFPATQPISAAALPLPAGAATETTLAALNAKMVSATYADFDTSIGTSNVEVFGLVLPSATGPVVAGTAANPIRFDPTGATPQPVTGPVTDAQMRATPIPVSGFPATQPISAVALPLPTGAATEATLSALNGKMVSAVVSDYDSGVGVVNVEMRGIALPGAGGPVQGGTAANPMRTDPTGTTVQPVSGPLTNTELRAAGVPVLGPLTNTELRAAAVPVSLPALTKGTQGTTGTSTQDLKDSGRNLTSFFMALPVLTTAADVLMSLTGFKGGATVAATTTPAVVSAGKTLRITRITITYIATASAGEVRVSLRANVAGPVVVASPVVESWVVGAGTPATAGSSQTVTISFPDGLEFAAGTGIGITIAGVGVTGALAVAGYGQVSLSGFEY